MALALSIPWRERIMNVRTVSGSAATTICLLLSSACSHRQASPAAEPAQEDVVLEVDNHNWADVLLYVVHDGSTTRLVQVTGAKSASITIPSRLVGSNGNVSFVAHRIGGLDDYYSPL
jgi:hypothetical protein